MKNRHSGDIKRSFPMAATQLGSHIGPGFASGVILVVYFARYGSHVLWMVPLLFVLCCIFYYLCIEWSRLTKKYDRLSFFNNIYAPYNKAAMPIVDIVTIFPTLW